MRYVEENVRREGFNLSLIIVSYSTVIKKKSEQSTYGRYVPYKDIFLLRSYLLLCTYYIHISIIIVIIECLTRK